MDWKFTDFSLLYFGLALIWFWSGIFMAGRYKEAPPLGYFSLYFSSLMVGDLLAFGSRSLLNSWSSWLEFGRHPLGVLQVVAVIQVAYHYIGNFWKRESRFLLLLGLGIFLIDLIWTIALGANHPAVYFPTEKIFKPDFLEDNLINFYSVNALVGLAGYSWAALVLFRTARKISGKFPGPGNIQPDKTGPERNSLLNKIFAFYRLETGKRFWYGTFYTGLFLLFHIIFLLPGFGQLNLVIQLFFDLSLNLALPVIYLNCSETTSNLFMKLISIIWPVIFIVFSLITLFVGNLAGDLYLQLHPVEAEIGNYSHYRQYLSEIISRLALVLGIGGVFTALMLRTFINGTLLTPLGALQKGVEKVNQGDLSVNVPVMVEDEIGFVTRSFNRMVKSLQQANLQLEEYALSLEKKVAERTVELEGANLEINRLNKSLQSDNLRMSRELEVTRKLQQMILPREKELLEVEGLEIASYMAPADEVGGDYYDVQLNQGRVKIGIGDVTGHGLESGVIMIMVQTAVKTLFEAEETDPVHFLSTLNKTIFGNVQRMNSDKNLTLILMDYEKGRLRLSGQHEEVIIVRKDGQLEMVDTMFLGFPVGLEENITAMISDQIILLAPGDTVVLYTDGITEAENKAGEQFGLERLQGVIRENNAKPAREIKDCVIQEVMAFIGDNKIYDDITLLVLKEK